MIYKDYKNNKEAAADTTMVNTGGRSRRRLSFPPVQEQTEDE